MEGIDAFVLGGFVVWFVGYFFRRPEHSKRGNKLMISINAAADEELTFTAIEADREGNAIGPIAAENVALEIQGSQGNFGEVIEGTNRINPGTTPAEAVVRMSDRANPQLGFIDVHVTLKAGAPATITGKFYQNGVELPVEETPSIFPPTEGGSDPVAPGADESVSGPEVTD